jgi:hypothetical protein
VGFVDHGGPPAKPLISHSCATSSIAADASAVCHGDRARAFT